MKRVLNVKHIEVDARAGAELDECIKEAIVLAATERRDVILLHNQKEFHIKINELVEMIMKRHEENKKEEI